jgi:hypothetical protein
LADYTDLQTAAQKDSEQESNPCLPQQRSEAGARHEVQATLREEKTSLHNALNHAYSIWHNQLLQDQTGKQQS